MATADCQFATRCLTLRGSIVSWRRLLHPRCALRTPLFLLLAIALTLGVLPACGRDAPNERAAPEAAFTAFRLALSNGDTQTVWAFLDAPTREALQERADRAAAAGVSVAHPAELLVAGWVPGAADIAAVTRASEDEQGVTLSLESVHGGTTEVRMTRDGEGWTVRLPLDPAEAPAAEDRD